MDLAQEMDHIQQVIQTKIDALGAVTSIPEWRYYQGRLASAQAMLPEYNDSGWEQVRLMKTWSSADGEAWFRATLQLPEQIEGIALAGTTLDLEIFLAIGASVYVNGVERFSENFWTDSRAILLRLSEHWQPGEPLHLAVRCNAGDGFGLFLLARLRLGVISDLVFNLDLLRSQFNFTHFLVTGGDTRVNHESTRPSAAGPVDQMHGQVTVADTALADEWSRAADALDLSALVRNNWEAWWASVSAARSALQPFMTLAKEYQADLVAHSHIDMNWLWPWRETVEVCRRDFSAADRLMDAYPEFRFSQSMASTYAAMEAQQPELFTRVQERVREGRWDITANTWVEGDLNMAAGESLVRQILHTRRYITSRFGVQPLICWEPDTFGHTANYPQILAKSGIRYYYFCRAGKRHPLFWWEGIDGSRVLAVQDPRGYGGENNPSDVVSSVVDFAGRYGIHRGLYVYGAGDHGGGATARDIEMARKIDAAPFVPHAKPSSSVAFYEQAANEAPQLPVVKGELNTVFEGCYTSHGDIKRLNRNAENALLTAEAVATLAAHKTAYAYPLNELAEAWRTLCFHQFHDILCGCAIGVTYREAHERMAGVLHTAHEITNDAVQHIISQTTTRGGNGLHVTVLNPLGWERNDVVHIPLSALGEAVPMSMTDEDGNRLPVQVCGDQLFFVARHIPSFGMRTYQPSMEAPVASHLRIDPANLTIENGIFRLHVNPASGSIDSLMDGEAKRDLAGPWAGWGPEAKVSSGMLNRLHVLWEQPHAMSAWNIGDISRVDNLISGAEVKVVEQGPVRVVVEVQHKPGSGLLPMHSTITQRIVLYDAFRRIDFETWIDWHEKGSAHADAPMLRAAFTPYLEQATGADRVEATYEVAFAGITRPADGREVPALRWADVSNADYGVALLNNGKYGYQAEGHTLALTLVRASYEPDNNPDEGVHQFTYSLYPHLGDWKKANIEQRGAELNQPMLAAITDSHTGKLRSGQAWVKVGARNVMISALKQAEDQTEGGSAAILRVYEAHGQPARTKIHIAWPVAKVEEVDLNENPIQEVPFSGGGFGVALKPHEIKTFRLVRPNA